MYVAHVGSLTSDLVTVAREAWTISLSSSKDEVIAGQKALLTATASQSVTGTGGAYAIDIFDVTAGKRLKTCLLGKVCTVYTDLFYLDEEHAHTFIAVVAAVGSATVFEEEADVQAFSDQLQVSRQSWQLTTTINKETLSVGQTVVGTVTANQNVGLTNGRYAIYVVDVVSGTVLSRCTTGTICRGTVAWQGDKYKNYVFVGFIAAMGDPQTFDELVDIQAGAARRCCLRHRGRQKSRRTAQSWVPGTR